MSLIDVPDLMSHGISILVQLSEDLVGKYFRLCGPYIATQLCCCSVKAAIDNTKRMRVTVFQFYLWILKFEFHVIFMCHEIFLNI